MASSAPSPANRKVTAEEVLAALEALAALTSGWARRAGRVEVIGTYAIAVAIHGSDPSAHQTGAQYGGKTPDGYMNEVLSMTRLRTVLDTLVAEGAVRKVVQPAYMSANSPQAQEQRDLAYFPGSGRSGYVLSAAWEQARVVHAVAGRDKQRAQARLAATRDVLARHAAEVETAYEEQCHSLGLDPTPERVPAPTGC